MRTRVVAAMSGVLLVVLLTAVGPPAGAGQSPISDVQITPQLNEGDLAHLTGNLNASCPSGEKIQVNWGDGATSEQAFSGPVPQPFEFIHKYLDDHPSGTSSDSYSVRVDLPANTCHGQFSTGARTTVDNVAPELTTFDVIPQQVGRATRVEATFADPGSLDTFTVTINWGDGSANTVLLLPAVQKIRAAHKYEKMGQITVFLSIADDDTGATSQEVSTFLPSPVPRIVTGAGKGRPAVVKTFDDKAGQPELPFTAYRSSFTGGVRVALGDVSGDGLADVVTAPGAGAGPLVKVWTAGGALLDSFFAYRSSFTGGVFVATGDVNGDGYDEIVTAPGAGGAPLVKVFDGFSGNVRRSFMAYNSSFTGGVRVAVGDVDGDGTPDIITGAGPGAGPHVKAFSGLTGQLISSFFAFNPSFTGGVFVAAGDVTGDGAADIVVGADAGGGPLVKAFSVVDPALGPSLVKSFFAYNSSFTGGVRVAAGDLNGDGLADIITGAGPGAGPHVKAFNSSVDGGTLLSFFPYAASFTGGVYVGFASTPPTPGP